MARSISIPFGAAHAGYRLRRAPSGVLAIGRRTRAGFAVLALTAIVRLLYGAPHAGYDAWFALVWGRELAHGQLPTLDASIAPTPHPLANAARAALSVLGPDAPQAVALSSVLAFACAGVAAYALGRRLCS